LTNQIERGQSRLGFSDNAKKVSVADDRNASGPQAYRVEIRLDQFRAPKHWPKRPAVKHSAQDEVVDEGSDLAEVVAFLASDSARWITGRTRLADGGLV
jgi:NAD(P)-dependent dehydrogenase (short-subunit alcohol dehydrogenase family)